MGQEEQRPQQRKARSQELVQITTATIIQKKTPNTQGSYSHRTSVTKYMHIVTEDYGGENIRISRRMLTLG